MQKPIVHFHEDAVVELEEKYGLSESKAVTLLSNQIEQAERRVRAGFFRILEAFWPERRAGQAADWNKDPLIVRFFGGGLKGSNLSRAKFVRDQFYKVETRISRGPLRIRVLPQSRGGAYALVRNDGAGFSPNMFKLYPFWFEKNRYADSSQQPDAIVRAMFQGLFVVIDKKVDGHYVVSESSAARLAERCPSNAIRSPENYEWFSRRAWEDDDWIKTHLGSRSMLSTTAPAARSHA
jgi:hypothetical protein